MTTRKWIAARYTLPVHGGVDSVDVYTTGAGWYVAVNFFDEDGNMVYDYDAVRGYFDTADDAMRAAEAWLESQEIQR